MVQASSFEFNYPILPSDIYSTEVNDENAEFPLLNNTNLCKNVVVSCKFHSMYWQSTTYKSAKLSKVQYQFCFKDTMAIFFFLKMCFPFDRTTQYKNV